MPGIFNRGEMQSALTEAAHILSAEGVRGRILVFGGAALALEYVVDGEATRDVGGALAVRPRSWRQPRRR